MADHVRDEDTSGDPAALVDMGRPTEAGEIAQTLRRVEDLEHRIAHHEMLVAKLSERLTKLEEAGVMVRPAEKKSYKTLLLWVLLIIIFLVIWTIVKAEQPGGG